MEQQSHMQEYFCRLGLLASANQMPANKDFQLPNVATRLQADEQAFQEWCSKVAEIRKKTMP
jgi:hypothetical protein